jgi:hypothetical protein
VWIEDAGFGSRILFNGRLERASRSDKLRVSAGENRVDFLREKKLEAEGRLIKEEADSDFVSVQ